MSGKIDQWTSEEEKQTAALRAAAMFARMAEPDVKKKAEGNASVGCMLLMILACQLTLPVILVVLVVIAAKL